MAKKGFLHDVLYIKKDLLNCFFVLFVYVFKQVEVFGSY